MADDIMADLKEAFTNDSGEVDKDTSDLSIHSEDTDGHELEDEPHIEGELEDEGAGDKDDNNSEDGSGDDEGKDGEGTDSEDPDTGNGLDDSIASKISHWAAEDQEMFTKQTPEAQEWLLGRHSSMEADYTKKTTALAEFKNEYEPVHEMFKPYLNQLQLNGTSPKQLIHDWATTANALQQDPEGTIRWLAQQNNVNLTGNDAGEGDDVFQSPQLAAMQEKIDNLESSLAQQNQMNAQAGRTSIEKEISEFSAQKTEAGELAHPFFDDVVQDIIGLVSAEKALGRSPTLKELYDKAIWTNPDVRKRILATQKSEEEQKRLKTAREKSAKAKKAASSIRSSTSVNGDIDDADDDLRTTVMKAAGRN